MHQSLTNPHLRSEFRGPGSPKRQEHQVLSQRGRYALKAMLNLARAGDDSRQVGVIATEEQIPKKFLEAIMGDLRRAELVKAQRGKFGGYRLARPPGLISFAEVMRVIDGPLALLPCASRNFYRRCDDCVDEATCVIRGLMSKVRNEVSDILDRTTLSDALQDPSLLLR
jgi:Rrf2 family protein